MKPAPFRYAAPRSLDEVLELKAAHGEDARFLAGGQSLIPTMNFRLAQPAVLIDLNRLPDLGYVHEAADGALRLGALVRHRTVERDETIARRQPLAHQAARFVAHPQVRNRGTLCGNLAHADPASEMPAVMLALGARMHGRSAASDRWIEAADFFRGVFVTALEEDELLVEVELPGQPEGTGAAFLEVSRRPGDFAMAGLACLVRLDADGRCGHARLAYCGVGDTPRLSEAAASSLLGRALGDAEMAEAGRLAADDLDPPGTLEAAAGYRRQLVAVLTERALKTAVARAGRQGSAGHA